MSANNSSTGRRFATQVKPIAERFYLSESFADFHFIFKCKKEGGPPERIPVQKIVLASASDVFQVMFNGSWKEKVDVEIVDASVDAFKEFLQFFYLSEAIVTSENVAEVMNLGKKYDVAECFNVCGQYLKDHLTVDEVCDIYELASHLEHKELEEQCMKYIQWNSNAILTSEDFLKCDPKVVLKILQMDLWCWSEVEVFEALVKWMKAKIEPKELTQEIVQLLFSDLMHEVRFSSMSMDEFLSLDPSYEALFTLDEYREIVKMINSEQFQPKIFNANRRNNFRSIEWNEKAMVKCNRIFDYSDTPYFIKNIETTIFTVDKPLVLGAFACDYIYLRADDDYQYPDAMPHGSITIIELPDPANSNRKRAFHKEEQIFGATRVTLPKPIFIRPELKYEIQIEMQLPSTENLCTAHIYEREVHMEPDITVKFHNDPMVDNQARGLIYSLEFNRI